MKIGIVMNYVQGGWSPLVPEGWGGGEEQVVGVARALARRGHDITVFYNNPQEVVDEGVTYKFPTADLLAKGAYQCDIGIYWKSPEEANAQFGTRRFLWTDQERAFNGDIFERIVVPSPYLHRMLGSLLPRCADRISVVPNGFDPTEVSDQWGIARDPKLILHASSPDRGLEQMLDAWELIAPDEPEARLVVAYGWELFDKYGGDPRYKQRIQARLAMLPRVAMRRFTREEMSQFYHTAGIWAYHCTGGEQFCITAIRAQLAGCVPVVKPWGALADTVVSGELVNDFPEFVGSLRRMLDPTYQENQRAKMPPLIAASPMFRTYDQLAACWEALWEQSVPATATLPLFMTPGSPPLNWGPAENAAPALMQAVQEWSAPRLAQPGWRFWVDPTLALPPGTVLRAEEANGAVIGWSAEDAEASLGQTLASFPDGTDVLLVTSYGMWRPQRRRQLLRRDLVEVLGKHQDLQMRTIPLSGEADGLYISSFRLQRAVLGQRDLQRVRTSGVSRQTISACLILRDSAPYVAETLRRLQPAIDELCVVDTGSVDRTLDVLEDFRIASGLPVIVKRGTSPRWCFDCHREHALGEMGYGHRIAGFEFPRNESIALAQGDWCFWVDGDELLCNATGLHKYAKPNCFQGYSVQQHHHSVEPPGAMKVDLPVRMFRRIPDGQTPGVILYGDTAWPTFHPALTTRFGGLVHEHPGAAPTYGEGISPVIVMSDVHLAHSGYFTEDARRRRFVRNWPLMVADQQKYPGRRLGKFLWLRDMIHHLRYTLEQSRGQPNQEAMQYANEAVRLWRDEFSGANDPFAVDALGYATNALAALQRGFEVEVAIRARKPEATEGETVEILFNGRVEDGEQLTRMLTTRFKEFDRWTGAYL